MAFQKEKGIQMVAIDLDGTILNNEKKIGNHDLTSLEKLGKEKVIRVFATGRSLYSALKVLPISTPVDYLVFSCGAGIYDWSTQEVLFNSSIEKSKVLEIENLLKKMNLNFSIHFPVPENHKYYYFKGNNSDTDFEWRNSLYKGFNYELKNGYPLHEATQFIVILNNLKEFETVASQIDGMKIVRATSPIDGKSVWLEIFNKNVSKALGCNFLCNYLNIERKATLSIGNDYNDLDLLKWTRYSYIVENAPDDLKPQFNYCVDNENNPLSYVFNKHWG